MNTLSIASIGLLAPGLAGWSASQAVLAGEQPYVAEPMPAAIGTLLPANERRRTTAIVKLALQVAQEAMAQRKMQAHTVLASSGGDSEVLDKICVALTQPDRPVSPTQFHHSVHNTPAGYWAIATGCMLPSLSLSAYDGSFAAGLREAAALAWMEMVRGVVDRLRFAAAVSIIGTATDRSALRGGAAAESGDDRAAPGAIAVSSGNGGSGDRPGKSAAGRPAAWQSRSTEPAAAVCHRPTPDDERVTLPVDDHEVLSLEVEP